MSVSRRKFIACTGSALGSAWLAGSGLVDDAAAYSSVPPEIARGSICLFSKHLHWMDYDEMAETAAEAGFEGVALTVRPKGHVLPQEATNTLPEAIEAVQRAGLQVPMITTAITDPGDAHTEPILKTAAAHGVKAYRMGYLSYDEDRPVMASLADHRARLKDLAAMNEAYGLHGAYQNHAGTRVGGPVWDLWHLLDGLNPAFIGCQYDIRHATVEGGTSWPVGLRMLAPYIKITALKDFQWEQQTEGWRIKNTPIGKGMVDFGRYFDMVRMLGIHATMSLHFEYPMPHDLANESSETVRQQTIKVMKRDVDALKKILSDAGL